MSHDLRQIIADRNAAIIRQTIESAEAFQRSPAYADAIRDIVETWRRAKRRRGRS